MVGCSSRVHLSTLDSRPCAATNCLTRSGIASRFCFLSGPAPVRLAARQVTTARSSTGFFGSCTPVRPGVTSPSATDHGKPCLPDSNGWRRDGTWVRIVTSLLDELDDKGQLDHDLWCIDGSVIRASRAAAGGGKKGAVRGGWEDVSRRKPRSRLTMRWGVREAVLAPRSTWFMTNTVSS